MKLVSVAVKPDSRAASRRPDFLWVPAGTHLRFVFVCVKVDIGAGRPGLDLRNVSVV
jgi:hypothetical protein